jgi:hypothetical protein
MHEIELNCAKNSKEGFKAAKDVLSQAKVHYMKNRYKKWLVCMVGVLIGCSLGLGVPQIYQVLSNSLYDRAAIEGLMKELIGQKNISAAMQDELLIVAYDYNSKQPRFYSKHFASLDEGIYDVQMSKATGGSSAAPVYFEPQHVVDEYGIDQLVIDGGIIGNNPSLFAYLMQNKIKKKTPIRIWSMGTGILDMHPVDADGMTRFEWLKLSGEFMIDIDVFLADNVLKSIMKKNQIEGKENYLRL